MTTGMARCDESAWRAFHAEYFNWLYAQALLRAPNDGDAAEIVQLTCLRAVRHVKPFECDSEFKNWLRCLMRCVIVDHTRQINRRSLLMEKFTLWQELRNDHSAERRLDNHEAIQGMLAFLPPEDADLIQLKYVEGWSTKELAERGQTTTKAIESKLGRLRKKLKNELSHQQERTAQ
ncbi:hypothetical protein NT6N_37180 [Oceaniferula spumae]|uniref:RNA polymerase subunit sigma-24 n=1 Tax=Oceaniferula spumae TaxID=2979115 RepID=A0AAT9FRS9_9BACT